jgi:hypothetical protein
VYALDREPLQRRQRRRFIERPSSTSSTPAIETTSERPRSDARNRRVNQVVPGFDETCPVDQCADHIGLGTLRRLAQRARRSARCFSSFTVMVGMVIPRYNHGSKASGFPAVRRLLDGVQPSAIASRATPCAGSPGRSEGSYGRGARGVFRLSIVQVRSQTRQRQSVCAVTIFASVSTPRPLQ